MTREEIINRLRQEFKFLEVTTDGINEEDGDLCKMVSRTADNTSSVIFVYYTEVIISEIYDNVSFGNAKMSVYGDRKAIKIPYTGKLK